MGLNSYFSDGAKSPSSAETGKPLLRSKKEKPMLTWLLRHASFISLIILLLLALFILLFSFDISIDVILSTLFSANLYAMIALSYAIFVNSYAVAGDVRKRNDKYAKTIEEYDGKVKFVRDNGYIKELDLYVEEYKKEELNNYKKSLLMEIHLTEEDLALIRENNYKGTLTKAQIKGVKLINEAKPINLTTQALMTVGKSSSKRANPVSSLAAIKWFKIWLYVKRFMTLLITMLFVISVAAQLKIKDDNAIFAVILQSTIFLSSVVYGFTSANRVYAKYEDRTKEIIVFLGEFERLKNLGKTWES